MAGRPFHGPTIGVYRECEDGEFMLEAAEFLEENQSLILKNSSRIDNDAGVTVLPTSAFGELAKDSKSQLTELCKRAREDRESYIAPLVGESVRSLIRGNHFDIDSIAKRVEDELSGIGSIKARVTSPARLEPRVKGKRNRSKVIHFGVKLDCPESKRRIQNEGKLIIKAAKLALFGHLDEEDPPEGIIPQPHITLAKAHTDNAFKLSKEWNDKRRPGVVVLGPPKVKIVDYTTARRKVS